VHVTGDETHQSPGELQDGTGRRDHHDGEDKQWLGEIAAVEVGRGLLLATDAEHEQHQHQRPKSENDFDFTQQMPDARVARVCVR